MESRRNKRGFTLVEIMIVVLIIGTLLAIATPSFIHARESARAKGCQGNLREIVSAKERWAMDNRRDAGDTPTNADLMPFYTRNTPQCPAGGTYTIGSLMGLPECSIGGVRGEVRAHVVP